MKKSALISGLACALLSSCVVARAQMGYIVGTWTAAPMRAPAGDAGKSGETLREIVRVTIPGEDFTHVTLSNEFGSNPLTVGAVTLAHRVKGSRSDTPVVVTFGDKPNITIAPGTRALSGSIHFNFPALSEVVVSVYIPAQSVHSLTAHEVSGGNSYIAPGDQTASSELSGSRELTSWRYLVELDVSTATQSSVVSLGDDLTSSSGNMRWPDRLATRMLADQRLHQRYGILNEGITGNRLLADGEGPSAINRLERDVFDSSGYYANGRRYVILAEGLNDIITAYDGRKQPSNSYQIRAEDLIAGYEYIIKRAHAHGLRVMGATLTPYEGSNSASPDGERIRQKVNRWLRTTKDLDGIVDFELAIRDPADPERLLAKYDSGDHLHTNDAGDKALADSIDLTLFR